MIAKALTWDRRYSQLTTSKLNDLEEAAGQAAINLDALVSDVSALGVLVSPLQQHITTLQSSVDSIPPLVIMKADLQLARMEEIHRQSAQSNDAVSESVSGLHAKVDGLMERIQAAVDVPDARMPIYKLVSKRSNLASLCGNLDNLSGRATSTINALQRTPAVNASSCLCRKRSFARTERVSLWSWEVWDNEVLTFRHYKGCKYFESNGDERSRLRRLRIPAFLKNAIIITFYTSTGAGGHSLGSNLEFYATVDRKTSPAFRVMSILEACIRALRTRLANRTGSEAQWQRLALVAQQKLESLFRQGKAGAKDVDSTNQSLLHAAAVVVSKECSMKLNEYGES